MSVACAFFSHRCALTYLQFTITVPEGYPDVSPSLTFGRTTYHDELMRPYAAQADEIIRRCSMGYPTEVAVRASNPIKPPPDIAKVDALKDARITSGHVRDLKHDVAFLKKTADLREFNDRKKDGDHRKFAESTAERRAARRTLRKLTAVGWLSWLMSWLLLRCCGVG